MRKENPQISVVMPVRNAETYISESIQSILSQSFEDFELIVIDDGSTDRTNEIMRSYDDNRLLCLEGAHDFIASLNKGLMTSRGKYIARMDADDIMHPDRLKVQYSIMEEEPQITVCSSWAYLLNDTSRQGVIGAISGLVENPFLELLQANFVIHPSVMMRKHFLEDNNLLYQDGYDCAEDYKFWFEVVKSGGVLYVDSQPLIHYRISKDQVSTLKRDVQQRTAERIALEILSYLIDMNKCNYPSLKSLLEVMKECNEAEVVTIPQLLGMFIGIFSNNKHKYSFKSVDVKR